ncbi:MAG TPA: class I SAM-dependent methyltransferase [Thermoleophilaceae bacterium]|nr:class I SAM-dependent methyltransferase [Thermoleophilaceae bacterium]
MNRVHNVYCSSARWSRRAETELVPWGLKGVELGDDLLEIGPGFGATSRVLARRPGSLTILELEADYCERLREDLGDRADVVQGDATRMPFEDNRFSGVTCFTMLHHIPSPQLQDQLFAEALRVLRPGGVFAGTDSIGHGLLFKLIHIGDTLVLVDPDGLPGRLTAAGFEDVVVETSPRSLRFRARKPA